MLTLIVFIVILGLLVFVHELGHFLSAKKAGVKVEEFGFGFPPRLWGIKKGETIYSVNLIPLGGFVKILGEDGEGENNPHSFANKKIGQRAKILIAGVAMNILLGAVLLSLGYLIGLPEAIDDSQSVGAAKVQISFVGPGSPAEKAGLKIGDEILVISNGAQEAGNIFLVKTVQDFIAENKGQALTLKIKRGAEILSLSVVPRIEHPSDEGPMGVALARVAVVSYPWHQALWQGIKSVGQLVWLILVFLGGFLWSLISQGKMVGEVMGPVGIFSITGQAAQMGFVYLLQLTALLSVNLAIINILPFPALDGGRLLFLLMEKIKGSPVSQKVEKVVHSAGFVFLILLMAVVTLRDVMKLF